MGGQGNTKTFSFSFGGKPGASGGNPFGGGFDLGDVFSNLFGGGPMGDSHIGGSSGSARANTGTSGQHSGTTKIEDITTQVFNKEVADQGTTWLLLFYTPQSKSQFVLESVMQDVVHSLDGVLRVSLCIKTIMKYVLLNIWYGHKYLIAFYLCRLVRSTVTMKNLFAKGLVFQ